MRGSSPRARVRGTTSAPLASQTSATRLTKDSRVARYALAATFTNSAVGRSQTTTGVAGRSGVSASSGAYTRRSARSATSSVTPKTRRSGRRVSWIPWPSRRNSGFQASLACSPTGDSSARRRASGSAVPTGTVDLPTTRHGRVSRGPSISITVTTWDRSAPYPRGSSGVPTHTKCVSPNSAASAREVVNRSRPSATCVESNSGSPGSWKGTSPRPSRSTRSESTSTPRTWKPSAAMQAAWVAPR